MGMRVSRFYVVRRLPFGFLLFKFFSRNASAVVTLQDIPAGKHNGYCIQGSKSCST